MDDIRHKKSIAIIGGGAAALMLACSLDSSKYIVSIYEKNNTLGRKFLVAGDGGFNLTHSENLEAFINRYTPTYFIRPFLQHFSNTDFIDWLQMIGIETFVGSSKRVFPVKGIKPIQVLKAIEKKMIENKVALFYKHEWIGWKENELIFLNEGIKRVVKHDITVFALGGSSWKVTGSDGKWLNLFSEKGIETLSFAASNCAFKVDWKPEFITENHGESLKNVAFSCGQKSKKGEAVITHFGIEGSGVYAFSNSIREQLISKQYALIYIDFKLEMSEDDVFKILSADSKLSIKDVLLKRIKLSQTQYSLIKNYTTKEEYYNPILLAHFIKNFPITITGLGEIDKAISSVGGISLNELTFQLEFNKMANTYCIGEMLDWDAPTGGYLLQACFSMGKYLANCLNSK